MQNYLMSFVGVNYKWGGDDPLKGFDCSGLAMENLTAFGFKIPDMNAHNMFIWCQAQQFKPSKQLGALAFYGKREHITHVGICLNDQLMIEAGGGGSAVVDVETASLRNAFIRVRPILYRIDFIESYYPLYPCRIAT